MNAMTYFNVQKPSLAEAIAKYLQDFTDPDIVEECTLGDLLELEEEFNEPVWQAVYSLIVARRAFVAVPLHLLDWDAAVMPVTWEVGRSTVADIVRIFREPHAAAENAEGKVLTYDLFVENVGEGYPLPPAPYAVRDAKHPERPEGCNFPYAPIWPPEALQVEFVFDVAGVLVRYDFRVGERLP